MAHQTGAIEVNVCRANGPNLYPMPMSMACAKKVKLFFFFWGVTLWFLILVFIIFLVKNFFVFI